MAPRSKRQKPNDEGDLELQQMEGSSAIQVVGRQLQNVGKAKDVLIKLLKAWLYIKKMPSFIFSANW